LQGSHLQGLQLHCSPAKAADFNPNSAITSTKVVAIIFFMGITPFLQYVMPIEIGGFNFNQYSTADFLKSNVRRY
jgi:hypothetical protein